MRREILGGSHKKNPGKLLGGKLEKKILLGETFGKIPGNL